MTRLQHADPVAASFDFIVASAVAIIAPSRRCELDVASRRQLDPDALLRLARSHRIVPMVQRGIAECGLALPANVLVAFNGEARASRISTFACVGEEVRLTRAAEAAGLDVIFVKGATVAHMFYDDPTLKTSWDVDMLVARADLKRACAMLRDMGFIMNDPQRLGPGQHLDRWVESVRETAWRHPQRGTTVELHVGLSETPALLTNMGMNSPRQHTVIGGVSVPTLAEDELFAYLCVHGGHHGWGRLKWLIDIAALIVRSKRPVADLRSIATEKGAGRCGDVALLLCHELLGIELPAGLDEEMRRDPATRWLIAYSYERIDRLGEPARHLGPNDVPEMLAYMRSLLKSSTGLSASWQTCRAFWRRPYSGGLLWAPKVMRPLLMLAWLPWRVLRRTIVGAGK